MPTEKVAFQGAAGAELSGVLHTPDERIKASILIAHCFTCGKDFKTMTRLSKGLADAGYAVLRFDFTGLGESGGDFADTSFTTNVGDLSKAALTLIDRGYGACGMVGHSLGGAAALLAAHEVRAVGSLAVIGSPSTPAHLRHLIPIPDEEMKRRGRATVDIGGRPFEIGAGFIDDLDDHSPTDAAATLDRPLLVLHATEDKTVSISDGEKIFAAAKQPKGFIPLLNAGHLLVQPAATETALHALIDWFDNTLAGAGDST